MGLNILIAEPRDIVRKGMYKIFAADGRIEKIYEAITQDDLSISLRNESVDLVIVHQSLITDFTILSPRRFVILTDKLDITVFQKAYKYRALGYLLESASVEILRLILELHEGAFLIEPSMAPQIVDYLACDSRFSVKEELLTPREKEVVQLLKDGVDRRAITEQLHISEATLKTHIKNIMRKRENRTLL